MKTKTFLIVFLLLFIGSAQISAQIPLPANGKTGAVAWTEIWDSYYSPIIINGVQVDLLTGTVTMHNVAIWKNGEVIKANQSIFGEVQSSHFPYEVFRLSELDRTVFAMGIDKLHLNLLGNYGTHYILAGIYDFATNEFTFVKTVIAGNSR